MSSGPGVLPKDFPIRSAMSRNPSRVKNQNLGSAGQCGQKGRTVTRAVRASAPDKITRGCSIGHQGSLIAAAGTDYDQLRSNQRRARDSPSVHLTLIILHDVLRPD